LAVSFTLTVSSMQLYVKGPAEISFVIMGDGGGRCAYVLEMLWDFGDWITHYLDFVLLELYTWGMNFVLVWWYMIRLCACITWPVIQFKWHYLMVTLRTGIYVVLV